MNIAALMITGSVIFIVITLAFTIRITMLDDKIDKLNANYIVWKRK